jgi:hypothetical protein
MSLLRTSLFRGLFLFVTAAAASVPDVAKIEIARNIRVNAVEADAVYIEPYLAVDLPCNAYKVILSPE